jgi:CheY-like chemotaxis protein
VTDIVRETADFVLSGSNVSCDITVDNSVRYVDIDRGQVSQVIQNVVLNAVQAMPAGGVIGIHLAAMHHAGDRFPPIDAGDYVRVALSDQGAGIPREQLQRIFDPYFSTRDSGRGLGLATCYSIMKKHGGWIDVESEVGNGTTFYLYFPVAKLQPAAVEGDAREHDGGTLLIMDDDETVRQVLGEMCVTLGCDVVFARSGQEAVEMFRECQSLGETPDLVVLDLTVPGGIGGVEALAELRRIDPDVKAVATSGYATDPVLADHLARGFVGRLKKPYRMEEVKALLAEVITAGPRPSGASAGNIPTAENPSS